MGDGADLIFVSMEDWDDVWRRNQFVCAELSRRHPDRKILFVGLPIDVSNQVRRGRWARRGASAGRHTRQVQAFDNITLTHPVKLLPNTLAAGRIFNEWMFRRHVRRAAARMGLRDPILWLNPHSAGHMAGRMGERAVVYDITDDWTAMTQSPRLSRRIAEQDAALCRRADATIVCSERLFELKRPLARNLHLIPNGVDAAHYRTVTEPGPVPPEAARWGRPVLGYVGTVHPDRVDVPLVAAVAGRLAAAGGSVVLVGPDHLGPDDRRRLAAAGNVVVTGPVPYARVPEYMRAFDVCITPHRRTAFTESLNPIKLWEYLAAGKPVVSTDVAGFRDYARLVKIADDADGFVAAAYEAMRELPASAVARRTEATRHSWRSRLDAIEAVLDGLRTSRWSAAEEGATEGMATIGVRP